MKRGLLGKKNKNQSNHINQSIQYNQSIKTINQNSSYHKVSGLSLTCCHCGPAQ
jgi:hypothetical protein